MGPSTTGLQAGRAILGWLRWGVPGAEGWALRSVHLGGGQEVVLVEEL